MLISFCDNGTFWDAAQNWNTHRPRLSNCFKDSAPLLLPCCIFFILLPIEILTLKKLTPAINYKWSFLDYSRIASIFLLNSAIVSRLCGKLVFAYIGNYPFYTIGVISHTILIIVTVIINFLILARQQSIYTGSGVVWITLFILFLCSSVEFGFSINLLINDFKTDWTAFDIFEIVSYFLYFLLILLSLVLLSCSSHRQDYAILQDDHKAWPENECSFPNRISYWWVGKILSLGFRKTLSASDVWTLDQDDRCQNIVASLRNEIDREFCITHASEKSHMLRNDGVVFAMKKSRSSIFRVLRHCFGGQVYWVALLEIVNELMRFAEPLFVGLITTYAQNKSEYVWHGFVYVVLFGFVLIVRIFLNNQAFFQIIRVGTKMRSGIMSIIYQKALRLSNEARKSLTTGEIINLMSVDANRLKDSAPYTLDLIQTPVSLVLSFAYLFLLLHHAVWGAVLVTGFIFLLNLWLCRLYENLQEKEMQFKDKRMKTLSEILNGIKAIKLYAWEIPFEQKVSEIRNEELRCLRKATYVIGCFEMTWNNNVLLASLSAFGCFVWLYPDRPLTPDIVFVSLMLFLSITSALLRLPDAVVQLLSLKVSLERISNFLASEELDNPAPMRNDVDRSDQFSIRLDNASFVWESPKSVDTYFNVTLSDLNLTLNKGELVAVVGKIGSGKSSLLNAICGEMQCLDGGSFHINGSIAYVPQQSWIQNMTIKDNILFGKEIDPDHYAAVIDSCALETDFSTFPARDSTEVGERGINLSGGQKMRLNLARAIYQNSDIYLLDDPLASVDTHVGKHLFDKCIGNSGLLCGKTRILVTHNVSHLPECDRIVVLDQGRICESGSFMELIDRQGVFAQIMEQYGNEASREMSQVKPPDSTVPLTVGSHDKRSCPVGSIENQSRRRKTTITRLSSVFSDRQDLLSETSVDDEILQMIEDDNHQLIPEEALVSGQVSWSAYWTYTKATGPTLILSAICVALAHGFQLASTFWLQIWSDSSYQNILHNGTQPNIPVSEGFEIYCFIGLGQMLFVALLGPLFATFQVNAARKMHCSLLHSLFRAPMSFFDMTPSGRILNRCGKDISTIDESIPSLFVQLFHFTFECMRDILAVVIAVPYFLIMVLPASVFYVLAQKFYVQTARQLRRLEAVSRSPIFSHFQESVGGAMVIRAFGEQDRFVRKCHTLIDRNAALDLVRTLINRWVATYLDLFSSLLVCFIATLLIVMLDQEKTTAGSAGLALSFAISFISQLMWGVWVIGTLETEMVSVERVEEYTETQSEAPWETDTLVPQDWPSQGKIQFRNYSCGYRPDLPMVLHNLKIDIDAGTKIGVVGRTGAGKSSITLAIMRLIESAEGRISIDNVDIASLGLHQLRQSLTMIPQDPMVFSGALRQNIDPFRQYSDVEVWQALELSHAKDFVAELDGQLHFEIEEAGSNLSVGQRQLICLARALLKKSKILIMDEATASVDVVTDILIQTTVREQFKRKTVLTIAHRLNTVLDCDKILVLDKGKVVEFESPAFLLSNENSVFYQMYNSSVLS